MITRSKKKNRMNYSKVSANLHNINKNGGKWKIMNKIKLKLKTLINKT